MEIFNYLWFAFYGLISGVLAKTITPGKDSGGLIFTSILGICGSILGGYVFSLFGWQVDKGFSLSGLIP
ncbi:MAG: GlsB/YeaQ/YmgE family stress response membrane protein, partial [Bdellovibrionales bacterium]